MDPQEPRQPGPIVVKRVKKADHGHHGGAWKVAYADFVTAMMAFFLLLWLLASTDQETREGLADYFTPAGSPSASASGAGGVLGGLSVASPGSLSGPSSRMSLERSLPGRPAHEVQSARLDSGTADDGAADPADAAAEPMDAAAERAAFDAAERALERALAAAPAERGRVLVDRTPEGLRIQILDEDDEAMFASGSAAMRDGTRDLLGMVAVAVADLPHRLSLRGHTDAAPFAGAGYDNWELSSDRAHASRRALVGAGLDPARVVEVVGLADTELLIPAAPRDARNRRISIVLLRRAATAG
jgi:chemotaxis protein MotB